VTTRRRPLQYYAGNTKFRKWAEEARMIARTFSDDGPRDRMLAIAAEYDHMAELSERRDPTAPDSV